MAPPLTLLETISAIRALPTEPDIIVRACERSIAEHLGIEEPIHVKIFSVLNDLSNVQRIEVLVTALSSAAALTTRPGHETHMIQTIKDDLEFQYAVMRSLALERNAAGKGKGQGKGQGQGRGQSKGQGQ